MNDEIKEILENVKKCCDITIEQNFTVYQRQDILKLLDYITNLQEEKEDYKSRCEKAIPMLKELNIKLKDILKIGIDIKEISDIETILNGGDEE